MVSHRVLAAINGWLISKKEQGANPDPEVVPLMTLMFGTLDALYLETTKNLPIVGVSGAGGWREPKDKPNVLTLNLNLQTSEYRTIRSILALAGDLVLVTKNLKTVKNEPELGQFIKPLNVQAKKFEDARDFFTHMDEPLRDYSTHAAPVPHKLDCGVQFTANATNNIYVIWENGSLYFSWDHRHCKVDIDKQDFREIFNLARQLYDTIISNPISQKAATFMTGAQVYPPF